MKHGKIICIGWNYRSHLQETDGKYPDEPVVFLKPSSCLIRDGESIVIPKDVSNVQYEGELALIFGKTGKNISEDEALSYVSHAAAFNDVTARDLQTKSRNEGNPWSLSKGMDTFGPMSKPVRVRPSDLEDLRVSLTLNGETRQESSTNMMIFSIPKLIAYVSKFMTIEKGDIMATGTPEGVGELKKGDVVRVTVEGIGSVTNKAV